MIIWTAFFLVIMIPFVALGIDVAKLMTTRTQLQTAADAAALAGASALSPLTGTVMRDTALVRAQEIASCNRAFRNGPEPVTLLAGDITFPTTRSVQVTVRRDASSGGSMVTHVAQVLGIKGLDVIASASARAENVGTVECGLVPLFFDLSGQPPLQTGCGHSYTLKVGGGAGSNGNYGPLEFGTCDDGNCAGMGPTGANTYRCLLENGYCCAVSVGQVLVTDPGDKSGPTKDAIDARFASDTDKRQGICYQDYRGNGRRVLYIPLTTAPSNASRATVQVIGFAAFFIKNRPGNGSENHLEGEFIYAALPGEGGTGNGTLFTLRLIQ